MGIQILEKKSLKQYSFSTILLLSTFLNVEDNSLDNILQLIQTAQIINHYSF